MLKGVNVERDVIKENPGPAADNGALVLEWSKSKAGTRCEADCVSDLLPVHANAGVKGQLGIERPVVLRE